MIYAWDTTTCWTSMRQFTTNSHFKYTSTYLASSWGQCRSGNLSPSCQLTHHPGPLVAWRRPEARRTTSICRASPRASSCKRCCLCCLARSAGNQTRCPNFRPTHSQSKLRSRVKVDEDPVSIAAPHHAGLKRWKQKLIFFYLRCWNKHGKWNLKFEMGSLLELSFSYNYLSSLLHSPRKSSDWVLPRAWRSGRSRPPAAS